MPLPYTITGTVIPGKRLGRRLGFPTANILLNEEVTVPNGVYAVRIDIEGKMYDGVANIGARPTVTDDPQRFLEAYIFRFEADIYGKNISVTLEKFLRPEQKFNSVEALRQQIERDKNEAERALTKKEQKDR